ncbi:MAG TPA: family 16 glycosylhydrolase, partial [Trebonia sp.]|nr:family 16 glycosylhydrolase [Trebonia sp.]
MHLPAGSTRTTAGAITTGPRRTQARRRARVRRLLGAGALAACGAIGVSGLAACGGSAPSTAASAAAPASPPVATAAAKGKAPARLPVVVARATLTEPALPTPTTSANQAEPPETTPAADPMQPVAPAHPADPTHSAKPATPVSPSPPTSSHSAQSSSPGPTEQDPLTALPNFTPSYVQEFDGDTIPPGWDAYSGVPGGESAQVAQWEPRMCTFSGGEAHFMASGIDSCGLQFYGVPQEYGAWFARLKGDDEPPGLFFSDIFLLWPANNQWPPEIDIYEDSGGNRSGTSATLHNTVGNACGSSPTGPCLAAYEQTNGGSGGVSNDGTEWHTYGVEWTPSGVTWLIDGRVIFTAPASQVKSPARQPALPMYMDLQSQNLRGTGTPT